MIKRTTQTLLLVKPFKSSKLLSLLFAILLAASDSYAHQIDPINDAYIAFDKTEININTAFREIKRQTGLTVFFSNNLLNELETVRLKKARVQLKALLDEVLTNKLIAYRLNGNVIVLHKKEIPVSSSSFNSIKEKAVSIIVGGVVKDEKGEPLEGVNILEKGSRNATVTNKAGRFSLSVAGPQSVIVVSYVGYVSEELTVGNTTVFNITLSQLQTKMEEVVVVGYGRQKKETVTGSIVSVGSKELVQAPVSNISNALVGRVAGLTATQSSGEPGDNAATLRIRGIGTLNAGGQDPLVIIDGIQSSFSIMNAIDANEIENISVLKDASATAVYGVRGANGVIIVTTKRGRSGRPQLSFSSNYGVTTLATRLKMLESYDYAMFRNEAIRNDKTASFNQFLFDDKDLWKFQNNRDYTAEEVNAMNIPAEQKTALMASPALYYTSHDYFKEQYGGTSPQQQINLNISGGGNRVRYFTSVGHFSQKGVFNNADYGGADINSYFKRYNFRSNFDIDVLKNLKITADIAGQFATNGGILGNSQDGDITGAFSRHKAMLVSILAGTPFAGPGIVDGRLISGFVNNTNPLQAKGGASGFSPITNLLLRPYLTTSNTNLNANIKVTHTLDYLTPGLSLTGTFSYNDTYVKGVYRSQPVPQYSTTRSPANPAEILYFGGAIGPTALIDNYNNNKWRRLYFEGAANYSKNLNKHSITGLLLLNAQKTYDPGLLYNVPSGLVGLAGRVTYNYSQRYLAEVNMGYNGSENFPEQRRFGFFPAFSAGWIASNESFFPKNDLVSMVKLRGSYGEVGNDQIGGSRFLYLPSTWSLSGSYPGGYYFGSSNGGSQDPFYAGATENKVGNPNVTWERAKKTNVSLEVNFLRNRLSFIGDLFQEKRNNILWPLGTVPATVGASLPPANIGRVSNHGYEIQLGWADKIGKVDYGIRGNLSYSRNKIEYMDEPSYPYAWMNQTAYSIGQYKGLRTNGFYNTEEEASNRPYSNIDGNKVQPGDIRYVDINSDGMIDSKDIVPIGYSNLPRYAFSSNVNFSYKGFAASILFIGTAQGSFPLTNFYLLNPFYQTNGAAMQFQYDGRWTPEKAAQGITPTFPRASLRTFSTQNGVMSDFWLKSTDFIRLKNVELSYTFNNIGALERSGLKGIRLFVTGNNLYTWSHLVDGIDPEQQDSGGANSGYLYPMTRIYNFGVNIQF
ncbi:MAG: hypothetical protein JWR18_4312 [Segetibacter sp.]|nr:hypothetical protein [Segetibacter sp.]